MHRFSKGSFSVSTRLSRIFWHYPHTLNAKIEKYNRQIEASVIKVSAARIVNAVKLYRFCHKYISERIHMKLLVGYDGSNAALAATELAKRHARVFQAEKVYLVRSMEGGQDVARKEFDNAEHELGRVNRTFTDEDIPSEPHLLVRGLSPGEDLVQFAKENGIDEIIIGVRRRSKGPGKK